MSMNRFAYTSLLHWKNSSNNIILLSGIHGVGKTTFALDFARNEFDRFKYINCKNIDCLEQIIDKSLNDQQLLVFDNINGLKKLLYEIYQFSLGGIDCKIIVIDNLLKLPSQNEFPTPIKINYLKLMPLNYEEFLFNVNKALYDDLSKVNNVYHISKELNDRLISVLMDYLIIGGMPEIVDLYIKHGLIFDKIREAQLNILNEIKKILSSNFKKTVYKKLCLVIDNIFPSLMSDNKKFKISNISDSTRFKTFKVYLDILESINLISLQYIIKGECKLIDNKNFILHFFDIGILGAIGCVPVELYNPGNLLINKMSEVICNSFVYNELTSISNSKVLNWVNNLSRIEFILQNKNEIMGIEVKYNSSNKLKSFYSFSNFFPNSKQIRLNFSLPVNNVNIKSFPLYLAKSICRKFSLN